jgi:hypothetical protein
MGEGTKHDQGKVRMDLLPWGAVKEIGKVLTFGAGKYGDYNWQGLHSEKDQARIFAALHRHLLAWWEGETSDEETGLSHLAHAGCCILFLLWFELPHRAFARGCADSTTQLDQDLAQIRRKEAERQYNQFAREIENSQG